MTPTPSQFGTTIIRLITTIFLLLATAMGTTVTLQVTDTPDAQSWNNGTYFAQFGTTPGFTGTLPATTFVSGALSGTGGATFTLAPNGSSGSFWTISVCPNATIDCFRAPIVISGASQSVTLNPPSVRIQGNTVSPLTLAYADAEIVAPPLGAQYYNVTTLTQRQWNGTVWSAIGGGLSATATGYVLTNNGIINLKCDGSTDDTPALSTLLTALGTSDAKLIVPRGPNCVIGTITIPTNIVADFTVGAGIFVKTGSTITWLGKIQASAEQIFFNANVGQGAIDFTGDFSLDPVFPEWFGAYPSATAAVNTPAIQASIYAAFGCNTSPATTCRTNPSGLFQYNRSLQFSGLYSINDELKVYHVNGFRWIGQGKLKSGLVQTAANKRILDTQSMAYGTFIDMVFQTSATQDITHPLIDIDYDGTHGVDIRPQFITFYDSVFLGNGQAQIGILVAKSGGGAQGSNIVVFNPAFQSFLNAAFQIGTPTSYAQNAVKNQILGGDIQGSPKYGVSVYGGSIEIAGTTMENASGGYSAYTGMDAYCEAPQDTCIMRSVRSEGKTLAGGGPWHITDSRILPNGLFTFDALAGGAGGTNLVLTGTWVGGDGKDYVVTVPGTFGGLPLTTASSGSSTTVVTSGLTTNAFTGMKVSIQGGTGKGYYGIVTSNTTTTITFSGGLVSDYTPASGLVVFPTPVPDNTTQFVVEPNWGTQFTSGTVTFALMDFKCIDGPFGDGTASPNLIAEVVGCPGGTLNAIIQRATDLTVSRTDWHSHTGTMDNTSIPIFTNNIEVSRAGVPNAAYIVPWSFNRITPANAFKATLMTALGTSPVAWSCATSAGGPSCKDVTIGGRTYFASGANTNLLEFSGIFGPSVPAGVNLVGNKSIFTGGWSTGNALGGNIEFWMGVPGASGSQVNVGQQAAGVSWNTSTGGCLNLFGINNTSSFGTICAPATVTTVNNPFVLSNTIAVPQGTISLPAFSAAGSNTGIYYGTNANDFRIERLGSDIAQFTSAIFVNVPICDYAVGNNCLTFGTGTITATGAGKPTINNTSGPLSGNWQCTNITPVTVSANVTTDQNLMACTIPAGTLNAVLKNLRISAGSGVYSTPAASTTAINLKLKLCTVSGCASGTVINLLNITSTALGGLQATNDQFNITGVSTTQTAGASSAYEAHGRLLIDLGVGNTVADSVFADTNTATVGTIDSTVQLFLQETIAFSVASASNTATQRQLVVDTVN